MAGRGTMIRGDAAGGVRTALADLLASVLTLAVLGACAGPPPPRLEAAGHLPGGPGASFVFSEAAPDEARAALAQCLASVGMSEAGAGSKPAFLVQIGGARHPGGTQVLDAVRDPLVSVLPPAPHPPRPWPAKAQVETLSVSISALADGREVYRASVGRIVEVAPGESPNSPLAAALCDGALRPSRSQAGRS